MPSRILKESICSSDSIDNLTPFEETFFYRLIVNADDFGRFDARPMVLKNALYRVKERMNIKEIETALNALVREGFIDVYTVDGKPYLQFVNWDKHQNRRAKYSKYPDKPIVNPDDVNTDADTCMQMNTNAPEESRNRETRNRETRNEGSSNEDSCAELPGSSTHATQNPSPPPVIFARLELNDGTFYDVTEEEIAFYSECYQAVDIRQQFLNMVAWCKSNPKKRKTRSGIKRFINNWLSDKQNNGGGARKGDPRGVYSAKPENGYVRSSGMREA